MNLRLYTNQSINFLNRISPSINQLLTYQTYQVKNFNGNDHISNSVVLALDIDLRYLYVDGNFQDSERSSFWGSYWYCIGKTFMSKGKYRYTLKRDIFQPLDFLLANNNNPISTNEETELLNNRWLTEDAIIERGYTNNALKYRKDNLNPNRVKVKQTTVIPRQPVIGIFYKQREDNDGLAIDFDLVGQSTFDGLYDYEEENISENTIYQIDANNIYDANINNNNNDINRSILLTFGGGLSAAYKSLKTTNLTNETINYFLIFKGIGYNIQTTGALYPQIFSTTVGDNLRVNIGSIADLNTLFQNLTINNSTIKSGIYSKTGLSQISANIGIIKDTVSGKFYTRTSTITEQSITFSKADIRSMLPSSPSNVRQVFDLNFANLDFSLTCKVPYHTISTVEIATTEGSDYVIKADKLYPYLNSSPCKCILIDYNDFNWRWATNVSKMAEVINTQLIKYPPENWRDFSLQDENDDIQSISVASDKVSQNYYLQTPIPAGNKEYSMARLCSGSFKSSLDIDLYNNDGLDGVIIEYTLKPLQTTYYIMPMYKGLYNTNYSDKRCLIETEDLSTSDLDDEWLLAQYSDRNMFDSFNRQQESLILEQSWQEKIAEKELDISDWQARLQQSNYVSSVSGNIPIISGVAGAIGSWTGGNASNDYKEAAKLDYQMGQEIRADALSLQKDMFNFQVGNLKALAPKISSLDSLDIKTQFGFIIEIYETTQEEKDQVAAYKRWNGEPINALGKFIDYIDGSDTHLIKGSLIRSTYPPDILREINQSLKGGIYVYGI